MNVLKDPQPVSRRRRSRRRTVAFIAVALCIPLVLLAVIESALRLCGVGTPTSLYVHVPDAGILATQLNPRAEYCTFPDADLSGPEPRRFDIPKPANTYRVGVFGASSVIGFPYASALAFPRQLEVLLNESGGDSFQAEVLNFGVTSMMSTTVADFVEHAVKCDLDLIVLYTGHNEFYGPGGAASTRSVGQQKLGELTRSMRSFRVVQLASGMTGRTSLDKDLLESLPAQSQIGLGDAIYRDTAARYRENLTRIAKHAAVVGVPTIFCTTGCNLRHQGPLRSIEPTSPSQSITSEFREKLDQARNLVESGRYEEALGPLGEAREIFDEHSETVFLMARCMEAMNRHDEAIQLYSESRDLDGCRFRASSAFNDIVREVVAAANSPSVVLVDIENALAEVAHPFAPGQDLFLEHVHFTSRGHYEVARAIWRAALDLKPQTLSEKPRAGQPVAADWIKVSESLGIQPEDEILAQVAVERLLASEFFRATPTREAQQRYARSRVRALLEQQPSDRAAIVQDMRLDQLNGVWLPPVGYAFEARKDLETASELFRIAAEREPWNPQRRFDYGRILASRGLFADAIPEIKTAARLAPKWDDPSVLLEVLDEFQLAGTSE